MKKILKNNKNSFVSYPEPNFTILNKLNLKIEDINPTHILDNFESKGINYKFGRYLDNNNTQSNEIIFDWKKNLYDIINNQFREGVSYSLAVLGCFVDDINRAKFLSYGKHLLVNKHTKYDSLVNYIEGQIDQMILNLESDEYDGLEDKSPNIFFRYREISLLLDIYDKISNIKYEGKTSNEEKGIDNKKEIKMSKKIDDVKLLRFLNVIPLSSDFSNYGILLNSQNKSNELGLDKLYKFNHIINILIYNLKENQYSGIIYKNNKEYLRFNDIINNNSDSNYDLIRCIGKNKVYIKNGEIQSIDNTILSKKLIKIKRDLIRDVKYLTFDIECYLN